MKTKIAVSVGVLVVAGVASSYASPYLTMYQMRNAMLTHDADAFSSHVDFPAMRESLRAQFMTMMHAKMAASSDLKNNPFAGFGMMLGVGIVNQMIETMVTPAGVMALMAKDAKAATSSSEASAQSTGTQTNPTDSQAKPRYSIDYKDWSTVTAAFGDTSDQKGEFVFKRDGIWSWKLAALTLPDSVLKD
ncbi:DUF2939 domain-containing protein [Caballeronia sp. INSB1]|uniref:DUF2939 domain-containing protein n=1 Tax=Caballeronia sp. INSB1 TaxID=2921751 RepID=UPI0020329FE7|nr:DUF2939 domain-containing protein [Caballeronia sp. INSB1]